MKRIEPGMLCLVVSGTNAGRECTTVRRVADGQEVPELGPMSLSMTDCWLIRGPSIMAITEDDVAEWAGGYGLAKQCRLIPLSGGDKLEDLETLEDLEAVL